MEQFFVLNREKEVEISDGFLGNVFFYAKSKEELIATTQLSLIEKLIENGLKLKLENVLIIDVNEQKIRLNQLQKITKIDKCIFFGDIETEIGLNFTLKKYHIQSINNVQFLKADIAEILDKNAALKTKFWNELKKLFNI
ncbi:MAG TPA: hypothetical protein PK431_09295 [Chitinophagales bacterium]|nr:hypothetical protein [Chitinophagales bacterium]